MASSVGSILALDVGARRIGVARASYAARLAAPLDAIQNDADTLDNLRELCAKEDVRQLVVGLPRSLEGLDTAQTLTVRAFSKMLGAALDLPVHLQDEALTSVQAEAELDARGKTYSKGAIDSLAAVYILEDYLREHL